MKTIQTMKDIKELIKEIPDKVLDTFSVAMGDEGWVFSCNDGDEEDDIYKEYPNLNILCKYFDKLIEKVSDDDEDADFIWIEVED